MNRLGLLDPSSMKGEQKELYDNFSDYTTSKYEDAFVTKLPDGKFAGPFGVQLHTPEVGKPWLEMAKALAKIPGLPHKAREVATLVVGAHTHAAYEVTAHSKLSGIPKSELNDVHNSVCPDSFNAEEKATFKMANELFKLGPVSTSTWNETVEVLGVSGATAVVQYVAFYKYVATILNGFDAQVP